MVKVLERCFVDENKDDEYFKKYLKLSWNFANKYTELDKLKKDFEFKKNNIITYEFNKLYYNNYNYNSSLIIDNKSLIYYVNRYTNKISWKHPETGKTNLPGGFEDLTGFGL